MFFSLGKQPDDRFCILDKIGSWYFSHDAGWQQTFDGFYKGYFHPAIQHGNFCVIRIKDDRIEIDHDAHRSFPLWVDHETMTVTNLVGHGERVWADDRVMLDEDQINIHKVDIVGPMEHSEITMDELLAYLQNDLDQKLQSLQCDYPALVKKLFVSGGVDTVLLLAAIQKQNVNVSLLDYEHFEYDRFIDHNIKSIKNNHWAYSQIHHWRDHTMLLSGSCGDEFFFRGPYTVGLWSAWHDIDLVNVLQKSHGYHVGYFSKPENIKVLADLFAQKHQIKERFPTQEDLHKQILDINANDHQHWHLGNTITWTPYKDLEITKQILRLDQDSLIGHIVDAVINKKLIARYDPRCVELLSETKNHQPRRNLSKIFDY